MAAQPAKSLAFPTLETFLRMAVESKSDTVVGQIKRDMYKSGEMISWPFELVCILYEGTRTSFGISDYNGDRKFKMKFDVNASLYQLMADFLGKIAKQLYGNRASISKKFVGMDFETFRSKFKNPIEAGAPKDENNPGDCWSSSMTVKVPFVGNKCKARVQDLLGRERDVSYLMGDAGRNTQLKQVVFILKDLFLFKDQFLVRSELVLVKMDEIVGPIEEIVAQSGESLVSQSLPVAPKHLGDKKRSAEEKKEAEDVKKKKK